jgi:hypothetical protein
LSEHPSDKPINKIEKIKNNLKYKKAVISIHPAFIKNDINAIKYKTKNKSISNQINTA